MKIFQITLLCLVCFAKSYGQAGRILIEVTKEKHKSYTTKVIQSDISDSSVVQHLEKNLVGFRPVKNRVKKGKYTVAVSFIAKDGNIVAIECKNDPGFGLCADVVRALKKYGKWGSGK